MAPDSNSTASASTKSRKISNGKPARTVSVVLTPRVKGKAAGVMATRAATGSAHGKANESKVKIKEEFCVCKGPDDGTPMVQCSCCRDWYVLFNTA